MPGRSEGGTIGIVPAGKTDEVAPFEELMTAMGRTLRRPPRRMAARRIPLGLMERQNPVPQLAVSTHKQHAAQHEVRLLPPV
jgi:hypothetical protein